MPSQGRPNKKQRTKPSLQRYFSKEVAKQDERAISQRPAESDEEGELSELELENLSEDGTEVDLPGQALGSDVYMELVEQHSNENNARLEVNTSEDTKSGQENVSQTSMQIDGSERIQTEQSKLEGEKSPESIAACESKKELRGHLLSTVEIPQIDGPDCEKESQSRNVNFRPGDIMCFCGSVNVQVQEGSLDVFGYTLTPSDSSTFVHSPEWDPHCLLSLCAYPQSPSGMQARTRVQLSAISGVKSRKMICGGRMGIEGFKVITQTQDNDYLPMVINEQWKCVADELSNSDNRKILICGKRNSGKSTFSRYLINSLLNTFEKVAYLETDLGQSEFIPTGSVALNIISSPIFGPPCTHLQHPECSIYIGDNSPASNPALYVSGSQSVFEYYRQHFSDIPVIINTHGWVKGVGLSLITQIVRFVHPDHIVQLTDAPGNTRNNKVEDIIAESGNAKVHTIFRWSSPKEKNSPPSITNSSPNQAAGSEVTSPKPTKHIAATASTVPTVPTTSMAPTTHIASTASAVPTSLTEPSTSTSSASDSKVPSTSSTSTSVSQSSIESKQNTPGGTNSINRRRTSKKAAPKLRALTLDCYFSGHKLPFLNPNTARLLSSQAPYQVHFSQIQVHFMYEEVCYEETLRALNGSIVGLGVHPHFDTQSHAANGCGLRFLDISSQKQLCFPSVGLGLIRSIDARRQIFYVLSPVHFEQLKHVNTFLRGKLATQGSLSFQGSLLAEELYFTSEALSVKSTGAKPMTSRQNLGRKKRK